MRIKVPVVPASFFGMVIGLAVSTRPGAGRIRSGACRLSSANARARKDSEPSGSSRVMIGARSAARARAVALLALRPLAPSSGVGV